VPVEHSDPMQMAPKPESNGDDDTEWSLNDNPLESIAMNKRRYSQTRSLVETSSLPSMPSPNLMRTIAGIKSPVLHTTSRTHTDNLLHTYGVETNRLDELDRLMRTVDLWGIDVFLIDELTTNRPLTAIAYTVFHVSPTSSST
jgi:hypothetical protein